MGTSPKNCALLGRDRKTMKLKMTAKLNNKQTLLATVRELYQMYATFLTLLVLITYCFKEAEVCLRFRSRFKLHIILPLSFEKY
jgi:hypothetical protein